MSLVVSLDIISVAAVLLFLWPDILVACDPKFRAPLCPQQAWILQTYWCGGAHFIFSVDISGLPWWVHTITSFEVALCYEQLFCIIIYYYYCNHPNYKYPIVHVWCRYAMETLSLRMWWWPAGTGCFWRTLPVSSPPTYRRWGRVARRLVI